MEAWLVALLMVTWGHGVACGIYGAYRVAKWALKGLETDD